MLPEQARDLAMLSYEIGRQVGLIITRRGEVERVVVGGPQTLQVGDISRLRRGATRLAGLHLLRTGLDDTGLAQHDLNELARRRWDFVAVLPVSAEGAPGPIHMAHLLPQAEEDEDYRVLPPFPVSRPDVDVSALVRSLEDEFARLTPAAQVEGADRALLVSVTSGSKATAQDSLDELTQLARSADMVVVGRVAQRRPKPDPRTLMGPGKLHEVLLSALRLGASVLVFDQNLTPSQAHNLAMVTQSDLKFIDRTQLILDIFAQRARTREGKLQVEMAQMRYLLPRLSARDDGLSRLTGGIGGRGPGETRLEIDRRRVRQRLTRLKRDLDDIGRQRKRRRDRRGKAGLPLLSIVGYTNAGKSTLLNALTNSEVQAENRLFATLDPTTRRLRFPREREVIITDTVGFIRDLPPDLRQAFAATLEELTQADLLLHVADVSHPQVENQIQAVDAVLADLDLRDIPRLVVLNKVDRADPERVAAMSRRYQAVAVSALDPATLPPLLARLEEMAFLPVPEYPVAGGQ
jgi:GTP-binding protein HflX